MMRFRSSRSSAIQQQVFWWVDQLQTSSFYLRRIESYSGSNKPFGRRRTFGTETTPSATHLPGLLFHQSCSSNRRVRNFHCCTLTDAVPKPHRRPLSTVNPPQKQRHILPSSTTAASFSSTTARAFSEMASPSTTSTKGPVQTAMEKTLQNDSSLAPVEHLELWNESYKHKGPKDAESHFKAIVVSSQFEDKCLLERHRMVHASLSHYISAPPGSSDPPKVHALSIVAKTPTQWKEMMDRGEAVTPSPNCRGGDGRTTSSS